MDADVRKEHADALRRAAELLAEGPVDSAKRKEILRATEAIRNALMSLGFDEGGSRKRVVSFLRSVSLANGVIGKRTAHRLSHRTFEEEADGALKWLIEKTYLEDAGSEGFVLTESGYTYLDTHKADIAPPPAERRGPKDQRSRSGARPAGAREARSHIRPPGVQAAGAVPAAAAAEPATAPAPGEAVVPAQAGDAAPANVADEASVPVVETPAEAETTAS
jgi:hypothetical protein